MKKKSSAQRWKEIKKPAKNPIKTKKSKKVEEPIEDGDIFLMRAEALFENDGKWPDGTEAK